jgi:anti-sigma factor RsiW
MNCDQAIEFLPWLLNGTLEAGERDEVRRHLAGCERCRAALNDTREAWTIFDQHLPSDALVALAYGEAPQGIDSALAERHLAFCPQCYDELKLARMSRHLEKDIKVVPFPGPRPVDNVDEKRDRGYRTWRAAALAAGFAGLVAASGWFYEVQQVGNLAMQVAQRPAVQENRPPVLAPAPNPGNAALNEKVAQIENEYKAYKEQTDKQLQQANQQVAEVQQKSKNLLGPQLNAWSGSTNPADVVRSPNGPEAEEKVVPADKPSVLSLGTESEGTAVREIEIRDAGGIIWSKPGLRNDAKSQEYRVFLPRGSLKPGRYTLQLYETVNGKRVPRESYKIRVE